MDIEDYITKLSTEYGNKVDYCNDQIQPLKIKNTQARRKGQTYEQRLPIILEIKVLEAQRQAYHQARIDIESVEDYIAI